MLVLDKKGYIFDIFIIYCMDITLSPACSKMPFTPSAHLFEKAFASQLISLEQISAFCAPAGKVWRVIAVGH